ncbi:hypothetical protein [Moorena sp. SIO4G3]|nr:hypothetical protein [Moorena sp. SIO4G3]
MGRWGDGEIGGRESCTFDRNLVLKGKAMQMENGKWKMENGN